MNRKEREDQNFKDRLKKKTEHTSSRVGPKGGKRGGSGGGGKGLPRKEEWTQEKEQKVKKSWWA